MSDILILLAYAAKAVVIIMFVAVAGAMLKRHGVIGPEIIGGLGKLVFFAMLPCLLFTKIAETIDWRRLREYWVLPLSCFAYIGFGLALGYVIARLCRPREEFFRGVITATAFGNSSYLPIPLVMAVASIFPAFVGRANAAAEGVAYVSMFLIGFSPMLWTVGLNMLSGRSKRQVKLRHLLPPPVIGMLLGVVVGLNPFLKGLFCLPSGICRPLFDSAAVLAAGTVPCALVLLGGNLASGPAPGAVNKRTVAALILGKLIMMPVLAIFYVKFIFSAGLAPMDPLLALVLVVEAGTPPATNLTVMCAMLENSDGKAMGALLFWSYIASVPTLTFAVMLAMWAFG